jgi:hypothetical protein
MHVATDERATAAKDVSVIGGTSLPALIDRASKALQSARSAAEVLEAGRQADVAYAASKIAGRMAKQTRAHDTVIAACLRAQADASEIEACAKRRLSDEWNAAQERGEVVGPNDDSRRPCH